MSIATYSELQAAVQNWLDNSETIPAARVQEFIALTEADFNRRLRVRENLTTATGTLTAAVATLALPTGFNGVEVLTLTDSGYESPLALMDPDAATEAYYGYGNSRPQHYALEAANIRFYPTPDSAYTYTLRYWQRVPALSDSNTTNWLLTAHPDVYLYGALRQATAFLVDDPRVQLWGAAYESALEQVTQQSIASGTSGRSFALVEGGTP